jgi:hypothetical protein
MQLPVSLKAVQVAAIGVAADHHPLPFNRHHAGPGLMPFYTFPAAIAVWGDRFNYLSPGCAVLKA